MHKAYEHFPILEKLPTNQVHIESISCFDDYLLLGTKLGHLVIYEVRPSVTSGPPRFDLEITKYHKTFGKGKPICQMVAVPEFKLLISLSENVVSVHDLTTFGHITTLAKTKGASIFTTKLESSNTASGGLQFMLKLCVHCRRKLQLFYWKDREFHDLRTDLAVPDVPKAMEWISDSIFVGMKRDYFLINAATGTSKELFSVDRQPEPLIARLSKNRLALFRNNMAILVNSDGDPVSNNTITWSEMPLVVEEQEPYLIGVLPKQVEIRTTDRHLVQCFELQKPKFLCRGNRGHIYVASTDHVWRLIPVKTKLQISQVMVGKNYDLALNLVETSADPEVTEAERIELRRKIKMQYALEMFSQCRFEDAIKLFQDIKADPVTVISLYPNLLPDANREIFQDPLLQGVDPLPITELEGGELEKGLLALIEYLKQTRRSVIREVSNNTEAKASELSRKRWLHEIIDTTLLKCYVQTNDALVASLLRLKDNACHLEEAELVLRKNKKYSELSLDLLTRQATKANSTLFGPDPTIRYLQQLPAKHLDLIFSYAGKLLKDYPEDGIKVFTDESSDLNNDPDVRRDSILEFLERSSPSLAIQYLEFIIYVLDESKDFFHNRLAQLYREKVQSLMVDYVQSLPEGQLPAKAGSEPGELGDYRSKFIHFLSFSKHYSAERIIQSNLSYGTFYEERAILFGRIGRFDLALTIYLHVLEDQAAALRYCEELYDPIDSIKKDVYLHLLKLLLHPPELSSSLGIITNKTTIPDSDLTAALSVLRDHSTKLDLSKALELLPSETFVSSISSNLVDILDSKQTQQRQLAVLEKLWQCEFLQVDGIRVNIERTHFVVSDVKYCSICKKRIGNSVFARYPSDLVIHYGCMKQSEAGSVTMARENVT